MTSPAGASEGATRARGSISRRMLAAAAIWTAVVLPIAGWSLVTLYRTQSQRLLDGQIAEMMVTLAAAVNTDEVGALSFDQARLDSDWRSQRAYGEAFWAYFTVDPHGEIRGINKSKSFLDRYPMVTEEQFQEALSEPGTIHAGDGLGPSNTTTSDVAMRIGLQAVMLPDRTQPVIIYAATSRVVLDQSLKDFTVTLGVAFGVLALGLVIGVLVLIRYGLRPLHDIQDKLADVRSGRRESLDGVYAAELYPVVREINTLIAQNRKVVERARTQVGNLAHALKTPLAVLMNESRGSDRISEIVRRQAEAMSSNVNHYLKRAQAAAQAEVLGARAPVSEAVEDIARMLERLHRAKGIAIDVDADPKAMFRGERGDLDELVGNLLENAAKWCKSRVKVRVARVSDMVEVCVDDDGPGLPAEHRAKALERGKRLDESAPGTGLGLSIVTELADIYNGRFHLEDSPLGGLRARLELPAAPL